MIYYVSLPDAWALMPRHRDSCEHVSGPVAVSLLDFGDVQPCGLCETGCGDSMYRPRVDHPMKQPNVVRLSRLLWALLAGVLLALAVGGVVAAQSDTPSATVAPGVTANDVNEVAQRLYCPLCSGIRLDACELKACIQMKEVIALKLSEGESFEQIRDYFVEQYGPQVLGEPPRQGFNLLAWTLPVIVLVLAGVFFWRKTRGLVQRPAVPPVVAATPADGDEDDYERKLEEELTKYG